MPTKPIAAALACIALGGCGAASRDARPEPVAVPVAGDWRQIATAADRTRLRGWRDAWMTALARAQAGGRGADVAAEGALLQPDVGMVGPLPPAGDYRCRTIKVGAKSAGMLDYVAYPAFACRIDAAGSALSFTKRTGSQRPVGMIYRDTDARGVFLGTLALGDEAGAMRYGQDATRDMAGVVERIGPRRWRIAFPYPAFESTLDVIELVPAS
ncbi:DUF4893 domain-containing protein [Sphingomonas donggukensis]|uniref:DUF4893 domain-containing protein n=1 Tax=Sphingomonas donggukensis TaxID=2949093 RepID=A0ABY4TR30_9SPHN|nr:DUF4893 domain-containing protein [Sphingomonas donggukensis]URW74825.1 DUF4893 domain-containing protein [Sphingomonas donggukensis]